MRLEFKDVQDVINSLVENYHYKPLPSSLSSELRSFYRENIPEGILEYGDLFSIIYSKDNTPIAMGYDRVVVGDYGAYIEFSNVYEDNLKIKEGEEYRINEYYKSVKYLWLTTKDSSDCKIYYQLRPVKYADYIEDKFYVSVFEVIVES
jgi:hypothetical protein